MKPTFYCTTLTFYYLNLAEMEGFERSNRSIKTISNLAGCHNKPLWHISIKLFLLFKFGTPNGNWTRIFRLKVWRTNHYSMGALKTLFYYLNLEEVVRFELTNHSTKTICSFQDCCNQPLCHTSIKHLLHQYWCGW